MVGALFLKILAFAIWLAAMISLLFLARRQIRGLRTRKLLRVKRLLLFVSIGLFSLGVLPLLARAAILFGYDLNPLFQSITSLAVALAYLIAAFGLTAIYWLNPYDPSDDE